jgi:H+/gluconate symporter-like permease
MSAYFKGVFSTAVISSIIGSSSGGVRIMLQSIGDYLIQSGANLEVMHRLIAIAPAMWPVA